MRKRHFFTSRCLCLCLYFASPLVFAVPTYYTFAGQVSYLSNVPIGALPDIEIGDNVSYTFMVDRELDGYFTLNGVSTVIDDSPSQQIFYSKLLSNELIESDYFNQDGFVYENNYAVENSASGLYSIGGGSAVSVGNFSYQLFGTDNSIGSIDTWVVGSQLYAIEAWSGFIGDPNAPFYWKANVESQVFLVDISLENPVTKVPSPSALLLIILGLLVLNFSSGRRMPGRTRINNRIFAKQG